MSCPQFEHSPGDSEDAGEPSAAPSQPTAWPRTASAAALSTVRRHAAAAAPWLSGPVPLGQIEPLHQMRIVIRQLEAALRLFEHLLPRTLSAQREPLRRVLRALGGVRDHDEQLLCLEEFSVELSDRDREAFESLSGRLRHGRERAAIRFTRVLAMTAVRRLPARLDRALQRREIRSPAGRQGGREVVATLIRARRRRLRKVTDRLRIDSPAELFHKARRRAKHLDYAIADFAPQLGDAADDCLRVLQRAEVARKQFVALGATRGLGRVEHVLLGRLVERQRARAADARRRSLRAVRALRGKRWQRLARALGPSIALAAAAATAARAAPLSARARLTQ